MVGNTYTKRNCNMYFIQVIVYIHISQDIVMFDKSMNIIEWNKQKEMPLVNNAARASWGTSDFQTNMFRKRHKIRTKSFADGILTSLSQFSD